MKKERQKLFPDGKRGVNIDSQIYMILKELAQNDNLYLSQLVNTILTDWIKKTETEEEKNELFIK